MLLPPLLESETYRLLPLCTMASSSTHQLRTFSTPNWSTIVWTWLTLSTTCQSFPNCRPFKATTQLRNLYCFIQKFFLFSNSQKSFSSVFSDCVGVSCRCCCIHCFSVKITNLQNSPKNTSVGCYAIKGCSSFFYDLFWKHPKAQRWRCSKPLIAQKPLWKPFFCGRLEGSRGKEEARVIYNFKLQSSDLQSRLFFSNSNSHQDAGWGRFSSYGLAHSIDKSNCYGLIALESDMATIVKPKKKVTPRSGGQHST